jgi:tRNA (uracil-5-)-methyltransferase
VHQINPVEYDHQLHLKISNLKKVFSDISLPAFEVYKSEPLNFRMRAEFRIWHEDGEVFYAMNNPDKKNPYIIKEFPIGSKKINELMAPLLLEINKNDILKNKLFSAEFLTTLSDDVVVTLIYHKPIDEDWKKEATNLHIKFMINIIGRSRKKKLIIGHDYVVEKLPIDGIDYYYKQIENGFTQPNARINQVMLSWAIRQTQKCENDLLELYCGNGNFTCVLSKNFKKVLATEVSKASVKAAYFNLEKNNIRNVEICRMSSEEITSALNKVRKFRRLKNIDLNSYKLDTIFVDPPRAGLDEKTLNLLKKFKNILYISCNPKTLQKNIQEISATHSIKNFAVFDQFPYTDHLECGVFLKLKNL